MRGRIVVACLAAVTGAAFADYRAGVEAYRGGDYERARETWRQVADQPPGTVDPAHMAEASYALGMLYWLGQGVEQSSTLAARWLAQAADAGHANAQSKLGYLYLIGQGVPQSDFEALKWLRMAAHQGDADAQYNLGVMYRDGRGVAASSERALEWFSEAAAKGDRMAAAVIADYERTGVLQTSTESSLTPPESDRPVAAGSASNPAPRNDSAAEPGLSPAEKVATFRRSEQGNETKDAKAAEESGEPEAKQEGTERIVVESVQWPAGVEREAWIAARDPAHYTIQVIAVRQAEGVQNFIARHPELAPFAIYRQGPVDQPLWVLIQGDYDDLEEARASRKRFPVGIQPRDRMWIRQFSAVQDDLP